MCLSARSLPACPLGLVPHAHSSTNPCPCMTARLCTSLPNLQIPNTHYPASSAPHQVHLQLLGGRPALQPHARLGRQHCAPPALHQQLAEANRLRQVPQLQPFIQWSSGRSCRRGPGLAGTNRTATAAAAAAGGSSGGGGHKGVERLQQGVGGGAPDGQENAGCRGGGRAYRTAW